MQCSTCGEKIRKSGWSLLLNKPICEGCAEAVQLR